MTIQFIDPDDVTVGDEITVWYGDGNSGQDGTVVRMDAIGIATKHHDVTVTWSWDYIDHLTVDRPLPAKDCLNYNPDQCKGPVELHTTGSSMKAWPRCTFHQDKREASYEKSIERFADSDVPPPWIDRYGTGERWDNDY